MPDKGAGDEIDTDGGSIVDGDARAAGDFIGRDVRRSYSHQTVNVDLHHMPTNETERRQWMVDQILALRNALIGDERYGVDGLVDSVRKQQTWLIVMGVFLFLLFLLMAWQQLQINEILQQLSDLAR